MELGEEKGGLVVQVHTSTSTSTSTKPASRRPAKNFKRFWLDGHRQARIDLFSSWRSTGVCLLAFIWLTGLLVCIVFLNVLAPSRGYSFNACQPDGTFSVDPWDYKYWSTSGMLQITVGFGNLTFSEAKAADVAWQIGVGRGGQALLSFISWGVFTKYVTTCMEVAPITFSTYRMIFLQSESKAAMVFMVTTMIFILAFPTLANAMSGYSSNVQAYVESRDENFDLFTSFDLFFYTIHDGERIGRNNDYVVTPFKTKTEHPLPRGGKEGFVNYPSLSRTECAYAYYSTEQERCFISCDFVGNVSAYVGLHGLDGAQQTESSFMNWTLSPPVLNITAARWLPPAIMFTSLNGSAEISENEPGPNWTWVSSGQVYDLEDLKLRGSCQTDGYYQWGFSFVQLNAILILLMLWTIGILSMRYFAKATMKRRGRTELAGGYKAIVELSNAMHTQLVRIEEAERDLASITESTLRKRITNGLQGGSIAYETQALIPSEHNVDGLGVRIISWMKKEKYWLGGFLVSLGGLVSGFFIPSGILLITFFPGVSAAIILTLCAGSTPQSRIVIFMWFSALFGLVPAATILGMFLPYISQGY